MNMIFDQNPGYVSAVKDYFNQRITNLRELHKISHPSKDKFHFEILLLACCYIDALAGIFTDEQKTGKRFIELLIYFGETNEIVFSKVNLLFLQGQIRKPITEEETKLSGQHVKSIKGAILPKYYDKWISDEIGKRDYSVGDNTAHDLTDETVLKMLHTLSAEKEKKIYDNILRERIRKSTYAGVLYENYRNPSVHEALVRGHWSSGSEDRPFYVDIIDATPELSFPPLFLIKVVENILSRIYNKCEEIFLKTEIGE